MSLDVLNYLWYVVEQWCITGGLGTDPRGIYYTFVSEYQDERNMEPPDQRGTVYYRNNPAELYPIVGF